MFLSGRMPCAECGESVPREEATSHTCDPRRRVEFQMGALQERVRAFEGEFASYLATDRGQFETWAAARQVRGAA